MAQTDRGATWTTEEAMCLLELWVEDRSQDKLRGQRRNIDVYRQIASDLHRLRGLDGEAGRTAEQCRSKLKALVRDYHTAKEKNNKSGAGRNRFVYFDIIDRVLHDRPSTSPAFSLDTSATSSPSTATVEGEETEEDEEDIGDTKK